MENSNMRDLSVIIFGIFIWIGVGFACYSNYIKTSNPTASLLTLILSFVFIIIAIIMILKELRRIIRAFK